MDHVRIGVNLGPINPVDDQGTKVVDLSGTGEPHSRVHVGPLGVLLCPSRGVEADKVTNEAVEGNEGAGKQVNNKGKQPEVEDASFTNSFNYDFDNADFTNDFPIQGHDHQDNLVDKQNEQADKQNEEGCEVENAEGGEAENDKDGEAESDDSSKDDDSDDSEFIKGLDNMDEVEYDIIDFNANVDMGDYL
ncbi:uncharacterized protein LOC118488226 [Helianthus annuus]|uniref:uncharacterized protein LOC118488226 n=1 Tax=Helianthus annuus TaxID=4232 RepID=UPI00165329BD|nr:uncharacterized protein LOC118488226 [Helianthus annuus]